MAYFFTRALSDGSGLEDLACDGIMPLPLSTKDSVPKAAVQVSDVENGADFLDEPKSSDLDLSGEGKPDLTEAEVLLVVGALFARCSRTFVSTPFFLAHAFMCCIFACNCIWNKVASGTEFGAGYITEELRRNLQHKGHSTPSGLAFLIA